MQLLRAFSWGIWREFGGYWTRGCAQWWSVGRGAGRAVVGQDAGMRAVAERGAGRWPRSGGVLDAGDARAKGEHFSIFCPSFLLI